jgi:hypothetical protein
MRQEDLASILQVHSRFVSSICVHAVYVRVWVTDSGLRRPSVPATVDVKVLAVCISEAASREPLLQRHRCRLLGSSGRLLPPHTPLLREWHAVALTRTCSLVEPLPGTLFRAIS